MLQNKMHPLISTLSKALNPQHKTRIRISMIKKFEREWKAHLQETSDFLLKGKGVWWHKDNDEVDFHDVSTTPSFSIKQSER